MKVVREVSTIGRRRLALPATKGDRPLGLLDLAAQGQQHLAPLGEDLFALGELDPALLDRELALGELGLEGGEFVGEPGPLALGCRDR